MLPELTYDDDADALYVKFLDAPVARTREVDDLRLVDEDSAGRVIGVELLGASDGIDLHDLPRAADLERLIRESGLPLRIVA